MGSTVVTAQLASCLQQKGATVTVFSTSFVDPAKEMFTRTDINVVTDEEADLDLYSFDYVWVNSQILPLSIVAALDQFNGASRAQQQDLLKKMPCFIFNHMGAMETVSDEYPYIPLLEESIASLEVFVSPEAHDVMEPYYDADRNAGIPQVVFPNPAPQQFAFDRPAPAQDAKPESILFVSSHLPDEALQAMEILKSQGCKVWHIGTGAEEREVTPEVIEQADVVVTIGKTVQYCLLSATPVFVYDYLGGFGYLSDENMQTAQYANFSGRGGKKLSADHIVSTLLDGYGGAVAYLRENLAALRDQFDLGNQVDNIFSLAIARVEISFPYRGYTKTLAQQERFALRFWKTWYEHIALFEWTQENRDAIDHLLGTIDDIRGSVSFKAGRALTAPLRSMRDMFTRKAD